MSLTLVINTSLLTIIPAIYNCSHGIHVREVYFACKAANHVSEKGRYGGGELPRIGESWRGQNSNIFTTEIWHGLRKCHWNCHEKVNLWTPHTPWSVAPDAALTKWLSYRSGHMAEILMFWFEAVFAASGDFAQSDWGVYGCPSSWRFQWHYQQPSTTSVAADIVVLVFTSFGGIRGLWSGCVRHLWWGRENH